MFLLSPEEKIIASNSIPVRDFNGKGVLPVPVKKLTKGKYTFKAEFEFGGQKYSYTRPFRIPDMTPLQEPPVMVNHNVPSPWIAVEKKGEKSYAVLDRIYTFGNGQWPEQIISRGAKLFSNPPEIVIQPGGKIIWQESRETHRYNDYAILAGSGKNDSIKINWQGELWFDGMYKLVWEIEPLKNESAIEKLFLSWRSPAEFGKYVSSPVFRPWKGNSMLLRYDPNDASSVLLWHSGFEKGISWWCQSNANWVNKFEEKQIQLERNEKDLSVCINIISKPAILKKKASYTMTLIGTPARHRPVKFRTFNYECLTKNTYAMTSGWGSYTASRLWADDTVAWTSNIPRVPEEYEKLLDNWKKKHNIKMFCYAMPTHLAELEDEYDYFYSECATLPGVFWQGTSKIDGKPYYTKPCCQDTAVCDIMLWRLQKMFRRLPKLGGIYHDICVERPCSNIYHGCGGTDAFGNAFTSTNALRLRTYLLRVYKLTRSMSMEMMNHGHDKFNPIAHNFGDCWYPGEEITLTEIASNPYYFYCDSRTPQEYQFRFNSNIHGMGINLLGRGASPDVAAMVPYLKYFNSEGYFRQYTTPGVIFDFNTKVTMPNRELQNKYWDLRSAINMDEADFYGYWEYPIASSASKGVYISCYRWKKPAPYTAMLAIGNLSRREAKLDISIDYAKLNLLPNDIEFYDLWENEKKISLKELSSSFVKSPGFRLIGIRKKQ